MGHRDWNFAIMVILAGVLCIVKCIYDRKGAVRLQGTVTGFVQNEYGIYFPVITFTYQGQELSMRAANGNKKPKGQEGDSAEVLYRPKNQKYVHLAGNNHDIVVAAALLVLGFLYLVLKMM